MEKLILSCNLCPGDVVTLTAAVRDLHASHPGKYLTDVRTPHPDLWQNNPHITPIPDGEGRVIEMHYPLIGRSNQTPHHFIHGYRKHLESELGVSIEAGDFRGDIHLSDEERGWMSQVEEIRGAGARFWIIVSGGKSDFTAKHWDAARWQAVVNAFPELQFVQVGEAKDIHPPLSNVLDFRGKTSLRQLIRLVHHADGVLCPVTSLMHLAAAVPWKHGPGLRPCVVVAGGREAAHWEAYPGHRFLDTIGQLPCCSTGGCWKSRVWPLGDGDAKDSSLCERPVPIYNSNHELSIKHQRGGNEGGLSQNERALGKRDDHKPLRGAMRDTGGHDEARLPDASVPERRGAVHDDLSAPIGYLPACLDRITEQHVIDAMRGYLMEAPPVVVHKTPTTPCCGDKAAPAIVNTDPKSWGPHKWREWHAIETRRQIWSFIKSLPCEECRLDFDAIIEANPPPYAPTTEEFTRWKIDRHNDVNQKLGKPVLEYSDAESAIERNRSRRHAEIHERGAICRVCEHFAPATEERQPVCLRNGDEPLKVKIKQGNCDKWPGYVEPEKPATLAQHDHIGVSAVTQWAEAWRQFTPEAKDGPATSFGNTVGVVIGTYGALPYIHLQLESLRRFHPGTPVLVVDDGSPQRAELAALCKRYGAEFTSNPVRMNHARGDMQAFIEGHEWAAHEEIGLLVKLSRRWIPIAPWIDEAVELWERTGAPTLCNTCSCHGFGFRSECVAMDVAAWDEANACKVLSDHIGASANQPGDLDVGKSGMLVEHIAHIAAAKAKGEWTGALNFEPWPWMGKSRCTPIKGVLWHETHKAPAYAYQAAAWGLNLPITDFINPHENIPE